MSDVTQILSEIEQGDAKAADTHFPLVYDELRKLVAAKLGHEKPSQTLQATALAGKASTRGQSVRPCVLFLIRIRNKKQGLTLFMANGLLFGEFTLTDPDPEPAPNEVDRISGGEIIKLASAATPSLKASRPVAFGSESYSGNVQVQIQQADGTGERTGEMWRQRTRDY